MNRSGWDCRARLLSCSGKILLPHNLNKRLLLSAVIASEWFSIGMTNCRCLEKSEPGSKDKSSNLSTATDMRKLWDQIGKANNASSPVLGMLQLPKVQDADMAKPTLIGI